SASRERRQYLDDRPLGQRDRLRRAGARLFPVHQERGNGQHPAELLSGRPPRHHRGQRLGQGGGIQRLLSHPGGMLRRCPLAHSYHWHVGYPRSHRLRAVLPRALRQIHGGGWSSTHGKARRWQRMSELYLLTNAAEPPAEIMPALGLLLHTVRTGPADMTAFEDAVAADAILVDARRDLIPARQLCQLLRQASPQAPVLALMTEGGLAAVTAEWGADDVVLSSAGPAELEARLRLAIGRQASAAPVALDEIRSGELFIDEATYTARLRARVLDLTFKEFELLKFLAQHPGRVFTRAHLLQEVWGYDYFGGTRTVDVHVRRLRAKLGAEHEALIGTVRNVGYRFVPLKAGEDRRVAPRDAAAAAGEPAIPGGPAAGAAPPADRTATRPAGGPPPPPVDNGPARRRRGQRHGQRFCPGPCGRARHWPGPRARHRTRELSPARTGRRSGHHHQPGTAQRRRGPRGSEARRCGSRRRRRRATVRA